MNYYNREQIEWGKLLDGYGNKFLSGIGMDWSQIKRQVEYGGGKNPLIDLLKQSPGEFVQAAITANGGNRVSLDGVSRVVILAQMLVYDAQGGPEADNKPKALRRHWYAYFKQFAQLFSAAIDPNIDFDDPAFNIQWSGRQSKIYGEFVDTRQVTYRNLWIEDASRMIEADPSNQLIEGLRIIMAVEKDSLFSDFVAAAKALGASAVISGKGKNSKAATELMLRKLGWSIDENPYEGDQVLFMHLSDYDYDGQAVIGPTFAEQATRYLENISEARVGVNPEQVEKSTGNAWDASYSVKLTNTGYQEWAGKKALFWGKCEDCNNEHWVIGCNEDNHLADQACEACGGYMKVDDPEAAHGFEVESLRSSDYYRAMVDTLLRVVSLDQIVSHLRAQCRPDAYSITSRIIDRRLRDNPDYQKIGQAINLLREAQDKFAAQIEAELNPIVSDAIDTTSNDWYWLEDDPSQGDFQEHVVDAGRRGYGYPWRPFDTDVRNEHVYEHIEASGQAERAIAGVELADSAELAEQVANILNE